jgi:hypothetical protein
MGRALRVPLGPCEMSHPGLATSLSAPLKPIPPPPFFSLTLASDTYDSTIVQEYNGTIGEPSR